MSGPTGRVRSRRKPVVAVTGACGPLAAHLLAALVARTSAGAGSTGEHDEIEHRPYAGSPVVASVVGLDERRGTARGVRWRVADVSSPQVLGVLGEVDVVVHPVLTADLAGAGGQPVAQRRDRLVRQVQALSTACAAAGIRALVVLSSAMVYGARADNPVPLPEDAPLLDRPDDGQVGDLLAVEQVLARARSVHPGLSITVVRPAALVGPGIDTLVTRHFEAPRLLTLKGAQPHWQLCHVSDLADAVARVVTDGLGPVVTVGATGCLTQHEVEALSGMRHVELSERAAREVAHRLHRVGVLPAPITDLDYVAHPWVVGSQTLHAAGWEAAYDNAAALEVLLKGVRGHHAVAGRRLDRPDRRDAALGATSATVALIATAAIMRRHRRKGARG